MPAPDRPASARTSWRSRRRSSRCGHRPWRRASSAAQGRRAAMLRQLGQHRGVILGLDHHGDVGVVLGGGADHRRAADVDVLDAVVVSRALRDRRLERIEVDHQQVDRPDAVRGHRRRVLLVVADRQQPAVHLRVQRLHPAVHHLGKAGQLRDVHHLEPGILQRLGGAAGGDQLDRRGWTSPRAKSISPILSETESRARVMRRWSVMNPSYSSITARQGAVRALRPGAGCRRRCRRWRATGSSASAEIFRARP